jgi:beta-glucosidase
MRTRIALVLLTALAGSLVTAPAEAAPQYPFRDPRLSVERRVEDLLGRLTLDEKISLLHQYQPAIPRLGISRFKTGTEALHGLAWSTDINSTPPGQVRTATATVFPQAVGLGSTWDPALIKQVGTAVGTETRGYNSLDPDVWGLNTWAPVVNLLRDPRWGRNEEGYSEDAYLTGEISTAYAGGMRGDDPRYLRTAPTLKHYLANNNEVLRDRTSSNLRPRVKWEYDEQAFRPAIANNAATGVMSSYNLVNGRPMTAHGDLDEVVRRWTDETLLNVTDAWGPNNLTGSQAYYPDQPTADAAAIKAGIDSFTVDDTNGTPTTTAVKTALTRGLLAESDVDDAVRHILSIRVRLGEFDPNGGPYGGITMDAVNTTAHQKLARQAAGEAMVLLKNSRGALPLSGSAKKVAVVGPLADTLYTDWYSGKMPYQVTPRAGIAERLGASKVTGDEAVDRIALKEAGTGRYVTAGSGVDGANLVLSGTSAGATEQFDVFDWGQGVLTLRSVANGKYVERADFGATSPFVNRAPQPRDWFVQQQFKLEDAGNGTFVIKYVGFETPNDWEGPNNYLTVDANGQLILGSPDAAGASKFTRETVSSGVDSAVAAVTGADAAVVVVGSMPFINGREDHDRTTMALAESQSALIKAVQQANPHTVVVVENSYPTTLNWEQANVPAILWTTHAGQETGHAVADVLFGDVNPAGRVTQTWYRSDADLPSILDYDIIKTGSTYQYFDGTPLYAFGHGLSYSQFRYGTLKVSQRHGTVEVRVPVTNTSRRAGDEVVQLYTHQRTSRDPQPNQSLRAFDRVHLRAGETKTVTLRVPVENLAHWDVTRGKWVVETSTYDLRVGASAADIRQRSSVQVRGEKIPARDLSGTTRAIDFDDYAGVDLVDTSKARGESIGASTGDWVSFRNSDLRHAKNFTARVAGGAGTIEVRLDSPTGRLAGTATFGGTADKYTYANVSAPLRDADGRHDVFLVFTGDLRVDTFTVR